ncbi:Zim17 protein [Saccharomycopsis crataegensis]|uniref:Zim17 protein n=1 Tax=Saccharomycopsis crataegensis TaxID=43959 RepID=A0AAV5QNM5_9ASCO|nr:Zim17 protein [Saccharomycopsis crataegensis]
MSLRHSLLLLPKASPRFFYTAKRLLPAVSRKNFSNFSPILNKDESIKFPVNATGKNENEASTKVNLNEGKTPIGKIPQKLMISFTCKKCSTRSSHIMSKQAYTAGTVLIECPGCHNRHLIADHLKIFNDNRITIEDILKAKGETVTLGNPNDIEFDSLPESIKEKLRTKN